MKFDINDEKVINQIKKPVWFYANRYQPFITQNDFDYLINVIKKHPCFELIDGIYTELHGPVLQQVNVNINLIVFYDIFYNDPHCPQGIKRILYTGLGELRYEVECLKAKKLLEYRYPYVEQWINSVT